MSNTPEGHDKFTVSDNDNQNVRTFDSQSDAEDTHTELSDLKPDADITIHYPGDSPDWMHDDTETDGGETLVGVDECVHCGAEIDDGWCPECDGERTEKTPPAQSVNALDGTESPGALADLGESLTDDPLDILPGYMITNVDGKPTLNKRGVSVLAFHFDVDVVDYEVLLHPHECEFEAAAMRFVVERDGKTYVGHGEAHVDEMEKERLLRMAETRAYKRAVIFATGTGIVGYQEVMNEL